MPRVLLLVPTATYRAAAFLEAAAHLGAEVVVGSERQQALAGPMGDRFLLLPLAEPEVAAELIAGFAASHPLDAVLAVDDQGSLAAALASARLGLRHSPPAAVAATRNKAVMRELLERAGVAQPRFELVGAGSGSQSVGAAGARIGWPVVVKPLTLSASRGVIRADDALAAGVAHDRLRRILADAGERAESAVLVEEFVGGAEVALEGIVRGGELQVLAVFDKPDPLDGPFFEETIYVTPSRLSAGLLEQFVGVASAAVAALGLDEGPVHAELRAGAAGDRVAGEGMAGDRAGDGGRAARRGAGVRLIEVAARTIGGRCSKALSFATGATLEELVLAHALGRDDLLGAGRGEVAPASGVMMIPIPASGTLEAVDGTREAALVPGVEGVEITIPIGRPIRALPEGDRYLGFVFARGETPDAVEASLRAAHAALGIRIAPTH